MAGIIAARDGKSPSVCRYTAAAFLYTFGYNCCSMVTRRTHAPPCRPSAGPDRPDVRRGGVRRGAAACAAGAGGGEPAGIAQCRGQRLGPPRPSAAGDILCRLLLAGSPDRVGGAGRPVHFRRRGVDGLRRKEEPAAPRHACFLPDQPAGAGRPDREPDPARHRATLSAGALALQRPAGPCRSRRVAPGPVSQASRDPAPRPARTGVGPDGSAAHEYQSERRVSG